MWDAQKEAGLQQLGTSLGLFQAPLPVDNSTGLASFTGQSVANILPDALEKTVQPMQALLGGGGTNVNYSQIPRFFNTPAPQGIAQNIIGGAADLAGYLPAIIATEGGAATALGAEGLGLGATAARVGGAAAGFGLPMANQGAEQVGVQGAVGGLQSAAQDFGWKGKLAAGLLSGAAGYYEGQKTSPTAGIIQGALNLAGPTVIDPLVGKLFGHSGAAQTPTPAPDIGGGRPIVGQPFDPTAAMNDAQRAAHIQAITSPQDYSAPPAQPQAGFFGDFGNGPVRGTFGPTNPIPDLFPGPVTSEGAYGRGTDPYDAFAGLQNNPRNMGPTWEPPQAKPFDPRMGITQDAGTGASIYGGQPGLFDLTQGLQKAPVVGPQSIFSPNEAATRARMQPATTISEAQTGKPVNAQVLHGTAANNFSSFSDEALGSNTDTNSYRSSTTARLAHSFTDDPDTAQYYANMSGRLAEGRNPRVMKANIALKNPLVIDMDGMLTGDQRSPWRKLDDAGILTQAKAQGHDGVILKNMQDGWKQGPNGAKTLTSTIVKVFDPKNIQILQDAVEGPHTKLPTGVTKLLGDDVGFSGGTEPLKEGFTKDAFALGAKAKTQADVNRFQKSAKIYGNAAATAHAAGDVQTAYDYAHKQQYFTEAAEYATGEPKAASMMRLDPNYEPPVPGDSWKQMKQAGLSAPVPKVGDTAIHWTAEGLPTDATVTQVKDNVVNYNEHSFVTGEEVPKVATLQEFDNLQKHPQDREAPPNPQQPGESPAPQNAASGQQVKIQGKYGLETATIVGREGDTLHVEIDDPIFGKRQTSVLASDTRPVESTSQKIENGGVPFKDLESGKLRGTEGARGAAQRGEADADLMGSLQEGAGPSNKYKSLKEGGSETLTLEEGLKRLPPEAATILGSIFQRMKEATGQEIDTSLAKRLEGSKGVAYSASGRVALNLQWIHSAIQNWDKMAPESQSKVLMRIATLYGHEITHVAQTFGARSGLQINGMPLLKAVGKSVAELSQDQRNYIAIQLRQAKGEIGTGADKYLAGDFDAVAKYYRKQNPNLTDTQIQQKAAGEVMAEIGATELLKRTQVQGLPQMFRDAIDKFKQVLSNVIDWFRGQNQHSGVAALQDLQSIAAKMYDHFGAADLSELGHAFPASEEWKLPAKENPFLSGTPPPVAVSVTNQPLLKTELARIGIRAAVGGTIGGIVAPSIGGNQITTAEGIMLGGVAGIFGPALAKKLLSGNLPAEIADAIKASKGNPFKTMAAIMGQKSLSDLGQEGRFGWTGESSAAAKFVRTLEREFDLNIDPKMKALIEEGRGMGVEQVALVQDALDKARWFKPDANMLDAVGDYFEGRISKDDFQKLLTTPELQTYGQFITTAREATTTLTKMFAAGMNKTQFRDQLIDTSEKYLGRFYSAYKEGKFNMTAFDAAKKDLLDRLGPEYSDSMVNSILREHMREIQANRNLFTRRGNSGQKLDGTLAYRRLATEEEIESQQAVVGGLEHDPCSPAYLKEKEKLDWMESHKVTDNWRDWLGEYKNPVERMIYTFQKVHPSSISGKVFDMLDNRINSNGLKFAYTSSELNATRQLLSHEMTKSGADVASLQSRLHALDGYGALPEGASYGKLASKWVDRFTRDEVNTYATPFKWMDQPILRGVAQFNGMLKISRTILNPLTMIRNYVQMPMFGLIARTTAGDVGDAFNEIHNLKGEDYKLMLRRHIIGADYVSAELNKGPGHIFSGYLDSDIATKASGMLMDKMSKLYQQPDVLVRAGAFLSARRRFAQEALENGLADSEGTRKQFASLQEAQAHPDIVDKAVNFTERYTMNYDTVPRIVKIGRNLPFMNLFISYTSEITKILKNLTQDAIAPGPNSAGRMHAITTLGAMAAIPALMVTGAESQLSPQDKADWDKIKNLGNDYSRARFRIPTSRDAQGRFHFFDITNLLPADSYSQMIYAFSRGDLKAAADANPVASLQNTPLLNMVSEQVSGEDLQSGRKLVDYGRVREVLKEILPPLIEPGYEGQRIEQAFSRNDQGSLGLTNARSGVEAKPSDIVLNYLTAMRFGNVSLSTVQRAAIGDVKSEIATQQTLLRDVLNTNVPQPEKDRATKIYQNTVQELMLKFAHKLGNPAT